MTVTTQTLRQITKAYQLIRCQEMLHAAQALVGHYRQISQLEAASEHGFEDDFFTHQIDGLREQIQLIQYQLFVLGWTEKTQPPPPAAAPTTSSSIAYALCLSRIISKEKHLQKSLCDCLTMARSAGYNILELHLKRILEASQTRTEHILGTHAHEAA